jgi:hypothetical protein
MIYWVGQMDWPAGPNRLGRPPIRSILSLTSLFLSLVLLTRTHTRLSFSPSTSPWPAPTPLATGLSRPTQAPTIYGFGSSRRALPLHQFDLSFVAPLICPQPKTLAPIGVGYGHRRPRRTPTPAVAPSPRNHPSSFTVSTPPCLPKRAPSPPWFCLLLAATDAAACRRGSDDLLLQPPPPRRSPPPACATSKP